MFSRVSIRMTGLLILGLLALAPGAARADAFASPAFQRVWERADRPVAEHRVDRSWLWGDAPFAGGYEPYADAPGGQRLVQYFDKARMEINQPGADPNGAFYVTNGLLVVELLSGRLQTGDSRFTTYTPAAIAVAGDTLAANPGAPTYAGFARVATLQGSENQVADATGAPTAQQIDKDGAVTPGDAGGVRYGHYVAETRHNIADVFWTFMNSQGLVYDAAGGSYRTAPVLDWLSAFGYPISEPYWATVKIGGQDRRVLIQMFQRRVLTYNPANVPAWQVEMGNVGRHYADWRRSLGVPLPSGTPGPAPAPSPTAGTGGGAIQDVFAKADTAMNALTAMKGRSTSHNIQNGTPIIDYADYAFEAPGKFYVKVTSPRPGVAPDPVGEQIRIGDKFYQRFNNAEQWDSVTTSDTYRWPAYNFTYLGAHADEVVLEAPADVSGTPCQVIRVMIKNSKGAIDRYIHEYIATTDYTIRREVTEAQATDEHPTGDSTTDFFDFNVPNNIAAPANVKP